MLRLRLWLPVRVVHARLRRLLSVSSHVRCIGRRMSRRGRSSRVWEEMGRMRQRVRRRVEMSSRWTRGRRMHGQQCLQRMRSRDVGRRRIRRGRMLRLKQLVMLRVERGLLLLQLLLLLCSLLMRWQRLRGVSISLMWLMLRLIVCVLHRGEVRLRVRVMCVHGARLCFLRQHRLPLMRHEAIEGQCRSRVLHGIVLAQLESCELGHVTQMLLDQLLERQRAMRAQQAEQRGVAQMALGDG